MYAIVDIRGQQFKVEKDQKLYVHRLDEEEGTKVNFSKVLLIDNNGKVVIGKPVIDGANISAKIISHLKGDKVKIFKKKRRKGYKVTTGHRQYLSQIIIEDIIEKGFKAPPKEEKKATTGAAPKKPEVKEEAPKAKAPVKSATKKTAPAAQKKETVTVKKQAPKTQAPAAKTAKPAAKATPKKETKKPAPKTEKKTAAKAKPTTSASKTQAKPKSSSTSTTKKPAAKKTTTKKDTKSK